MSLVQVPVPAGPGSGAATQSRVGSGDVILVHGFMNRGIVMGGLARRLRREGYRCWVPTLRPMDGRGGLAAQARQLSAYVTSSLGEQARFILVGFSMGALVSRYFLQTLGGAARCRAFFSICGPHQGTWMAHGYPSQGVRELRPGSSFLRGLDADAETSLRGLPLVSYWTPFDAVVRPAESACWPLAESVRVPCWMHLLMLWDRRVSADIVRRLHALG